MISSGEDVDGIAFETAKACIYGLVDICKAAASVASTVAVIQGICSGVFLNVFTFFVSSFDGKDIFDIVNLGVLKIYEVAESFSDFKHEFVEDDTSVLLKLYKFRALSFLKILFSCPKSSLVACFELFESTGVGGIQKGNYVLRQLTVELIDVGDQHLNKGCDRESSVRSGRNKCDEKHTIDDSPASKSSFFSNSTSVVLKNCLLGLVIL